MLLATFIPDSVEIGSGIRPQVSARAIVTHNEAGGICYQPNGAHHVRVMVKAGETASSYMVGFAQVYKPEFQSQITDKSHQNQTFTLYFPLDRDMVFQLDEEHRRHPGEPVLVEVVWLMGANKITQGTMQQLDMYQLEYVQDPTKGKTYPILAISPTKWNDILKAYGWPQRRLVEIRFSKVGTGMWPEAATEITAAEEAFQSRQDANTLLAAERAFEKILGTPTITSSHDVLKAAYVKTLGSITNAQKTDTVAELLTWLTLYVRRMKHTQPTTPTHPMFDVDSGDAEFGLILSKAALSYLSRL